MIKFYFFSYKLNNFLSKLKIFPLFALIIYSSIPSYGIKRQSNRIFRLFECQSKPVQIRRRPRPVVLDPKLGRFNITKNRHHLLPGLHQEAQLVQTKIRFAVHGGENGHPQLAFSNRRLNLVAELVARFHVLAVQKRPVAEPPEVLVQQPRHVSFCVDTPVVDEHVARRRLGSSLGFAAASGAKDSAVVVVWTLHGPFEYYV